MQSPSKHEFFVSKAMLFFAITCGLFLSYTGIWILANMPATPVFVIAGFLLALCSIWITFLNTRNLINNTPLLVVTDEQIECIQWPFKYIKLENIDGATLTRMPFSGGYALNINVNNQDQLLRQMLIPQRLLWKFGRVFGYSPIAINLLSLRDAPDEVEKIICSKLHQQ